MFSGGDYDEVARWLSNFVTSHAKRENPRVEAVVEAGLPTLDSLGPTGGGMHDLKREYLHVDSIPLRGALLAGLIQRLCLSKSTGK